MHDALKSLLPLVPRIDQTVFCDEREELQRMHLTAQQKHTCAVVRAVNARYALSQLHSARRAAPIHTLFTIILPVSTHAHIWDDMVATAKLVFTFRNIHPDIPSTSSGWHDCGHVYAVYHVSPLIHSCDPKLSEEPFYCTFILTAPCGGDIFALFDSGKTSSYISQQTVSRPSIPTELLLGNASLNVSTFDGDTITSFSVAYAHFKAQNCTFTVYAGVLDHLPSGLDLVLGQDFMRYYSTSLHFQQKGFANSAAAS